MGANSLMFTKEADVHAVYGPLFELACHEMSKEARVFGEDEPRISDAEVPYESRKALLLSYAKRKSKEDKTPWSTALLTGGGLGAGAGGIVGALSARNRLLGGLGGAAAGGALGALMGAGMKSSDDIAIRGAKRLLDPDADIEGEIADRIVAQKRARESAQEMNAERRHRELMAAHGYGFGGYGRSYYY